MINVGEIVDVMKGFGYALTHLKGIQIFHVTAYAWMGTILALSIFSYWVSRLWSVVLHRGNANIEANSRGFVSDEERWDFADLDMRQDADISAMGDEV